MNINDEVHSDKDLYSIVISLVIPAFNEEGNLREIYKDVKRIMSLMDMPWELIFTDDGSGDATWKVIGDLNQEDNRVKGIRLSKNFGHQYSLLAGLSHASGQAIIMMDADLQHPPDLIPQMIDEWRKGNKIVHTVRLGQDNISLFKKYSSILFYKIFSFLSGVKLEPGMADFRLVDRRVLDSVLKFGEGSLFLRGIFQWVGFPSSKLEFTCRERFSGKSQYSLKKMVKFATAGVTSFSVIPLRIGILIGLITSLVAFSLMLNVLYEKIVLHATVPGWATTITLVTFMFGILFILIGLIGEYLGRVLIEVKSRPRYLVSEMLGINDVVDQIGISGIQKKRVELL